MEFDPTSIDWDLLSEQKQTLLALIVASDDPEHLDGILNLLDYLQDCFQPTGDI